VVNITKNKLILMSLLIIGLLFMVPVVESSFVDDVWFGITGFFSMLVTGNVAASTSCSDAGGICFDSGVCPDGYHSIAAGCLSEVVPGEVTNSLPLSGFLIKDITGKSVVEEGGAVCCVLDDIVVEPEVVCSELSCLENYDVCGGQETTDCNGDFMCGVNMFGECDILGQQALCGNGEINDGEVCDGTNLTGYTCADQTGFASGTLACSDDCLSFDTNACVALSAEVVGGIEESPSAANNIASSQKTCGTVGGTCTDFCDAGYLAYDSALLDITCDQAYDTSVTLLCCVSGDAQNALDGDSDIDSDGSDDSTGDGDKDSSSNSLKDSLKSPTETGPGSFVPEESTGIQRLFSDAGHVMGGVWVIFALVVVIVGTTYFLHKRFHKN
jgi:hypothetical protein